MSLFHFQREIMWPTLINNQYTQLKLSCRNVHVVKHYLHSNSGLDLCPNDPRIKRMLPLQQDSDVAKIVKDPIYRTKSIMWKRPVVQNFIYGNGDLDLWTNDPKLKRFLPLLQGNHVVMFGRFPTCRTIVIMRKRQCCQKLYL